MSQVLLVDIEAIKGNAPEVSLAPFMRSLRGKKTSNPIAQQREIIEKRDKVLEKVALTPVASRLLCIGVLETFSLLSDETWHFIFDVNEREMILKFKRLVDKFETKFVTFNGRSYDFPFLMFRAAINEVDLQLPIYPYNGRDGHFDMFVHLNSISNLGNLDSSWQMIGLKKWIDYFGINVDKPSISDGEIDLMELLSQGESGIQKIEEYVKGDITALNFLFKKFKGNFDI